MYRPTPPKNLFLVGSMNDYRKLIATSPTAVVAYVSESCPHCQHLKPVFLSAAGMVNPKIKMMWTPVDLVPEAHREMGIQGVPTLVAFERGTPVRATVGGMGVEELVAFAQGPGQGQGQKQRRAPRGRRQGQQEPQ